jgi:hypothetical protein
MSCCVALCCAHHSGISSLTESVLFHSKYHHLAWTALAGLEKNQFIHYAKGYVMKKRFIEGEEVETFFLVDKIKKRLSPGSLLFLLGNTMHAGSKFEGNKEALMKEAGEDSLRQHTHYRKKIGDLKLFFDIDGRSGGQKAGGETREQLHCFETGNSYGKPAGFTPLKYVEAYEKICFENDACSDFDECCKAEVNED